MWKLKSLENIDLRTSRTLCTASKTKELRRKLKKMEKTL